jgi:hypothetical protein
MYNDVLQLTTCDDEEWVASHEQMQDVSDTSKTIRTSRNT